MKPKLRFKGYYEEWKFIPFSDNFSILKNNTLSREGLTNDPSSHVANIHYGDILVKFGEIINGKNEELPWILNKSDIELNSQTLLKSGDVVFADTAEDEAVGKCVEVIKCEDKQIVSGLHTIPARPNVRYAEGFLGYYLNSPSYHNTLLPLMQGIKVLSLSKSAISKTQIIYPYNVDEQREIGEYFQKLDGLIRDTGKEIEKLENLKQASLQKMFPQPGESVPQLRVKGFSEPWQEKRLGEIGYTFTGLSGKTKEDFGHGDARFVTYMNVFSNPLASAFETDRIEIDNKQITVQKGDIFFTTSSETPEEVGMSSVWVYDIPNVYLNSFCFGFRPNIKLNHDYIARYLRSPFFREKIILLAQGISRFNISKTKVMELPVLLPSLEEQKAIGNYFRNLDNMISSKKKKLEKLRQVKSSCLNLMFV